MDSYLLFAKIIEGWLQYFFYLTKQKKICPLKILENSFLEKNVLILYHKGDMRGIGVINEENINRYP